MEIQYVHHEMKWDILLAGILSFYHFFYFLPWMRASLVAQLVKNRLRCRTPGFDSCVGKIPWRRERLPTPVFRPKKFHGLYSPWSCIESDITEQFSLHHEWRIDAETEALILWPPEWPCKELTHWKRPVAWKDWGQEEKGMTEDEMVG